jgi:hypothetical protein
MTPGLAARWLKLEQVHLGLVCQSFSNRGHGGLHWNYQVGEHELGINMLIHQKVRTSVLCLWWRMACRSDAHTQWSGTDYVNNLMKMVTGSVLSTAAMGKGAWYFPISERHIVEVASMPCGHTLFLLWWCCCGWCGVVRPCQFLAAHSQFVSADDVLVTKGEKLMLL